MVAGQRTWKRLTEYKADMADDTTESGEPANKRFRRPAWPICGPMLVSVVGVATQHHLDINLRDTWWTVKDYHLEITMTRSVCIYVVSKSAKTREIHCFYLAASKSLKTRKNP